jgi:hypothetical protein
MELNDNNGTPIFLGTPGSSKVRRSQLAFLRRLEGRSRPGDEHLLKVGVDIKWDSTCDSKLSEVFCNIHQGIYDNRIPGRQERERNGEDIADGIRYDMPDEDEGAARHRGYRRRRRRRRGDEEDEENDEESEDDPNAEQNAEDDAIVAIFEDVLKDPFGRSTEGKNIIEKVTIIVQHMTRPDPVHAHREEDAGCVIFFCVMDGLYSMGTPFQALVKMGTEHRLSVARKTKNQPGRPRGPNGGGRQQFMPEPSLMEHFPFLKDPDHISNGLLNFTAETYLDLAAFITDDPRIVKENRQENLYNMNRLSNPGTTDDPNRMHPALLFTVDWALQVMLLYGVDESQASYNVLKGGPGWLEEREEQVMLNTYVDRWYFAPRRSYHMLMAGFVWCRLGSAGLDSQYFPWFDIPAPLLRTTMTRSASNALVRYDAGSGANQLAPAYANSMIIADMGRPEVLPTKFYDPNVISRRSGIRMVTMDNARMMSTLCAPADPAKDLKAYEMYCITLEEYRHACLTNMMNVLKPSNHIYPSMNAILTWMATEMRCVSVPLPHYTNDPYDMNPETWPLDGFACYMIRTGLSLKNDFFLAGRADRWILVNHSAHDCHCSVDVKMHPSAIVHGPAEGGKSHMFESALTKACIPDTVTSILESSEKAWYVHEDSMGVIIRVDEAPKLWVDGKAAEADKSGTAERLKSMTTEHRATYRTLVLIEGANGRSERKAETIESAFHATIWVCTNKMVSHGDEAIASRFFNFIMTRSDCDLFEMAALGEHLNDDDRNRRADAIHAWRIKQALISITLVLIDSQIIPPPSMDVFDHMHTRVLAYFKEQGVNTSAIRKVDMVRRVGVIYVVLNGLICLYDNPGAKYAGKEFELCQLMDLIPYLYCSKQIAIFTMTQTEEVFLNPLRSAVLKGVMAFAKFPYVRGRTIEEYFKQDTTRLLSKSWKKEDHGDRGVWMDFNYIEMGGAEFKDIYGNIAECCDIKVGANEVQSVLEGLASGASGFIKVKRVQPLREDFYATLQGPGITQYTGLTRETETTSLQIVVRDFKNKTLYVAAEAINKLHDDLLSEAFQACLYSQWQPQEILTAYEVRKQHPVHKDRDVSYVGLFDVLRITPDLVHDFSFVDAYSAPNVAYITPMTAKMMAGPRLHPDKRNESYASERKKRQSSTVHIKEDLDVWGHRQHHFRAGCQGKPENSVSRPNAIRESVRRALQLNEDYHVANEALGRDEGVRHVGLLPRCLKMTYPNDLVEELDTDMIRKNNARAFTDISQAKQKVYEMELAEWRASKAPGAPPVMTTLCNTGRASRADYTTAEAAGKADAEGVHAYHLQRRGRARVRTDLQTIVNPMPDTTAPLVRNPTNHFNQMKLRRAQKIADEFLRQTGGGVPRPRPVVQHQISPSPLPLDLPDDYDALPFVGSLMPASDDRASLQAAAVHHLPPVTQRFSHTVRDGVVVLAGGLRPIVRPTSGTGTGIGSRSSSSSSAAGAAVPKKAPLRNVKKARQLASEVFDEEARALLARSESRGYEAASASAAFEADVMAEDEEGDSRSRPAFCEGDADDDAPLSGMMEGDDDDDGDLMDSSE